MKPGFNYKVTAGDCISSIAERYGFFWQTIWNANPELKALRKNPNVLLPGDIVKIPDLVEKNQSCPTDKRHIFVKKGTPAKFRLVLERHNVPLANRRYILDIDGKIFEGQTDSTGLLEANISPAARQGFLRLPDDQLECQLELGNLDPLDELVGVQQRLQNLGFLETMPSGEMDEDTRAALAYFQSSVNLPATGDLDEATRAKLRQMQDETHPQRAEENESPEPASGSNEPEEIEEITSETNDEEDAAEMARFTSLDD
jgi:hypothetical protein